MCNGKYKGSKCFRCNEFGDKASDCKREKPKKTKNAEEKVKRIEAMNSLSAEECTK